MKSGLESADSGLELVDSRADFNVNLAKVSVWVRTHEPIL